MSVLPRNVSLSAASAARPASHILPPHTSSSSLRRWWCHQIRQRPTYTPHSREASTWGRLIRGRPAAPQSRLGRFVVRASGGTQADLYNILGVSRDATLKDIKKAYRSKAKKLHPDVNKAADAQERFLECKMAYQVLSDSKSRADYDRKQRFRQSSSGGFDGDWFGGQTAWQGATRGKQQDEDFYGLGDFFNDLDKDLEKMTAEGGSLFSTLANDFVEFLEEGLKDLETELDAVSDDIDEIAREVRQRYASYNYDPWTGKGEWQSNGGSSSTSSQQGRTGTSSSTKPNNDDDDIDAMLSDLKKKMGL